MIYVDPLISCVPNRHWRHDESCHLMCDPCENFTELHEFAQRIGLKRCWFQNKRGGTPHYDLTAGKRAEAVRAGAIEIDRQRTVEIIRAWRAHRDPGYLDKLRAFMQSGHTQPMQTT